MAATENERGLKAQAASAAWALLGLVPAAAPRADAAEAAPAPASDSEGWNYDVSTLFYNESGGRMSVFEPEFEMDRQFENERAARLKLALDTISGATPTGALPSDVPRTVTVTSASGTTTSETVVGQTPTSRLTNVRVALDGGWDEPLGVLGVGSFGGHVSKEKDFISTGPSFTLKKDFDRKNTTLIAGVNAEYDWLNPVGGVPAPFGLQSSIAQPSFLPTSTGSSVSKREVGGLIGVTQILDRRTLMQVNFAWNREEGYLSNPYKLITEVNGATGADLDNIYENRPGSRIERSLYWMLRRRLERATVGASYRYFFDDWGIKSHTADATYHWPFPEDWDFPDQTFLEPHFRYYHQTQANFYTVGLVGGAPRPAYASADYRLARFDAYTFGLKGGTTLGGLPFSLRIEYYTEAGQAHPATAIGVQRGFNLFPGVSATIFQLELQF